MGNKIRNGVLALGALIALAYASVWDVSLFGQPAGNDAAGARSSNARAIVNHPVAAPAILSASGVRYVLEVRSLGLVLNRDVDDEIWEKIEQKADNFSSFLSQNENDYADSADMRLSDYAQVSGLAFREAAGQAVEYWPIPTIIWGPPRNPKNGYRAAADISGNRQQAGLGVHLFLWSDDANTNDGPAMVSRLFDFFDKHPDVPAALVFCEDGDVLRFLLGPGGVMPRGLMVPTIPNSIVGMLVSRSDRVDKLIRPFAVDQSASISKDTTQYDVTRLWNYYWEKSDGQGPDGFDAFYTNETKQQGYDHVTPVNTMKADWWQQQLPAFWKQVSNKGPGDFKPTPYLPIRWTTWQVEEFDKMPLIGYLHRPVDVKLTNDDGKLLPKSAQIAALKSGWASGLGTLEPTMEPKRVFYDTTGDRQWAIPITQALSQEGAKAPNIGDVKQGYDIGRRIGNTGVSSPMVQLGLGLIASYKEGGASATINRRPDGNATIMMVSPPDPAIRAAWQQQHGGRTPF
ncbi:hypothetical protein C0Z18_31580 [Trinickia dabaoshanensis]|uniref:DUF2875 domain-containing protein n=1 Tax=Trinickia dabaoshanensis TaxID=564714 RepID=A0A2N7VBA6_9BURK|nr:DUF2875 family protein [Trinickia dabaoshanensis]PMS14440.1 hypothetical protein C0Z18_31580 [Trinickia dabaoshanensis]